MATKTLTTKIILRNDTAQNWATSNPTPTKAEVCLETDTGKYKIGDGVTAWADLTYYVHLDDGRSNSLDSLINRLIEGEFGNVDDVTVNGTSVVEDKTAKIVIASLSFSDETQTTTTQSLTSQEVILHKISRTGAYSDLIGTPEIIDNLDSTSTTDVLSANQGNTLKEMIQGITFGTSFATIEEMVTSLNSAGNTDFNVGVNLYIQALGVPDFWIYSVEETSFAYSYTTDNDLISEINSSGSVQIGYYKISLLETEKVDLTDYVTNEVFNQSISELQESIANASLSFIIRKWEE